LPGDPRSWSRVRECEEAAPAKVNLTLNVRARRPDGYHELESLVVFARLGDRLRLVLGATLEFEVVGPFASAVSRGADNLVLKAARELAARAGGLGLGRFALDKRLPVAAGLGGGSADAAAALRLIARANGLSLDDARVRSAARATGADVPVCLDSCARLMRGTGEVLSAPLVLPELPAVLVNPGMPMPTADAFAAFDLARGATLARPAASPALADLIGSAARGIAPSRAALTAALEDARNDLQPPAISIQSAIGDVLASLHVVAGCRLARMSGSGATCFALFDSEASAVAAAKTIAASHPGWWVEPTVLGG
jgi:4-diphosphocytidyl-2-C-methyl-D-erythritol kinase